MFCFVFQAEDGIRDAQESRGLGDVYKRQVVTYEDIGDGVLYRSGWRLISTGLRKDQNNYPHGESCDIRFLRGSFQVDDLVSKAIHWYNARNAEPVSYTHLTLPTIYSV